MIGPLVVAFLTGLLFGLLIKVGIAERREASGDVAMDEMLNRLTKDTKKR